MFFLDFVFYFIFGDKLYSFCLTERLDYEIMEFLIFEFQNKCFFGGGCIEFNLSFIDYQSTSPDLLE